MKCETVISAQEEERVIIYAHERRPFIEKIEALAASDGQGELFGYTDSECVRLERSEIECVSVIDGKVVAITQRGRFRLRERLYMLEESLGGGFVKINKSALANIDSIERFSASFGASLLVTFKCGYSDYISRRQIKNVKERLYQK